MTKILKKIKNSQYFKFIFQLTMGSAIAQLITIIVSPISTRLYTPEQLGIYTLVLTVSSMFGPVLSGKYDMAIVSADDDREVYNLIVGSALFSFVTIILITIGYHYYLKFKPEILNELGMFAYLIIPILIVVSVLNILNYYNNRYKDYKIISLVYVIRTVFQNLGLVVLGFLKFGSLGLLLSQLVGSLAGLKKQGKGLYRNRSNLKKVHFNDVKSTLIKYKNQPLFSMPAQLINSSSYSILNFFISGLFGVSVFGYYSMSYRVLGLPLSLISMNVSKVFFQRATEEKSKIGNYNKSLKQITLFLMCMSIPMVIILVIFGPQMFELAFGDGWGISGSFARILAPMYGIRLIVSALTPALIVSGEQKLELIMQSVFLMSSVGTYFISKTCEIDINSFLTLITITYSIIYLIFYIIIYRLSKKKC